MNTIKITINVPEGHDPAALGEAIASLIKAVTPPEQWAEVADELTQMQPIGWIDGEPIYTEKAAFELGYLPQEIPTAPEAQDDPLD